MSNAHNPFALAPVAVVFFYSDALRFAAAFSEPTVVAAAQAFRCAGAFSTDRFVGDPSLAGLEPGGWLLAFHDYWAGATPEDMLEQFFWAAAGSEWSEQGTSLFFHPETESLFAKPL